MAKRRATGFGQRLKELREAAGLTQSQLADRAGLHLHGLTKLEHGDREPVWATVVDLASALGISCEAFNEPAGAERPPSGPGRPPKATPAPPPAEDLIETRKAKRGTDATARSAGRAARPRKAKGE